MARLVSTVVTAVALALPAAAVAASPTMTEKTAKGAVLATPKGMTLYTFDKDVNGKSACTGSCAAFWPPFLAKSGAMAAGNFGIITRADGHKQWTYKGHPLYTFAQDAKPKQVTGDGFKGVWHAARP